MNYLFQKWVGINEKARLKEMNLGGQKETPFVSHGKLFFIFLLLFLRLSEAWAFGGRVSFSSDLNTESLRSKGYVFNPEEIARINTEAHEEITKLGLVLKKGASGLQKTEGIPK